MFQQIKTYLLNNKLVIVLIIVAAVAVSSAAWNWYHPQVKTLTRTEYQTVEKEKIVEKIKTVTIPGPERIVTIEKIKIVEKLVLPPSIADDPNKVITGNADIGPSEGGTSVVSVLDVVTGETEIIAKEKPVSLFGFPSNIEAGVRYGLSTQDLQQAVVNAKWDFLRVGSFYVGIYGEINSKPSASAMLAITHKF
jgi:hypothetical protein